MNKREFCFLTNSGDYKCVVVAKGWSYAVPVVYKRVRGFLGLLMWQKVYEGEAKSRKSAECMHKDEMQHWCWEAMKSYEAWAKSWSDGE